MFIDEEIKIKENKIEIKASVRNQNNDMDIEFYKNEKLILTMDWQDLRKKINRAVIKELDMKEN